MAQLYFRVGADFDKVIKLREEIAKLKNELKNIDSTQSPAMFNTLNAQLSKSTKEMNSLVSEAAKAGAAIEGDFRKKIFDASQVVNGLSESIITQKGTIQELKNELSSLKEKYQEVLKQYGDASGLEAKIKNTNTKLREQKESLFNLTQQQAEARLSVKKLRDEYSLYKNDGKQVIATNQSIGISLGKALGVIGGVAALKQLGSEIIRVRGEFQSMQTAIETMVGKDMADELIPHIKELAKISPLTMSDMVGAEKMMLGFNIQAEDTIKYLKALSDISMGESSKFNSLTLAFSQMSAAGKLMGQDLNQMINAGFNPLQIISEKTGKSIATLKDEMSKGAISAEMVQQAFLDATSAGGKFYNMSENASKTINGQLSMMQDALDNVFNELGIKGEGIIMSGIQMTTSLIHNYETVGKVLVGLIAIYGAYRTAVMLVTAAESKHTLVEIGLTNARILARKAQLALNAAMLTNPYVLLATAVIGLGAAIWAFHDSATEMEKAQKRFNEQQEEAAKQEQKHKQRIDSLIESSRDIALADLQRGQSLAELRKEYPKIFTEYDIESIKLADILKLKHQIAEEDAKRLGEKRAKEFSDIESEIKFYESLLSSLVGKQGTDGYAKKLQELRAYRDEMLKDRGKGISEQFISNLKDIDISEFDRYIFELEKRIKGKGENGTVKLRLPIDVKGSLSDEAIYNVKDIKTLIDTTKETKKVKEKEINAEKKSSTEWLASYKKAYEDADKAYKDFLSSKQVMSDADRDKELKRLKGLRDSAKATYEAKGGSVSSDNKQESAVEKLRRQQEAIRSQNDKIAQIQHKQAFERKRQAEDLEMQLAQSEIDARSDSFEKQQAQRELNNKKEIQSIQRQKDDYIRAYIQAQKEIFDAEEELKAKKDKTYTKKTFDSSSVSVDTSAFDAMIDNTTQRQLNEKIREQEDAWNEYLIKFGSYQQKLKALIEKYDKQIEEAKTAGEAAILEKEKQNALDELDNSVKNSTTLMGQLFADASQKSANEIQKIIEKAELLMQYLGAAKDAEGNAQIGGKTVSQKDILGLGISSNTLQNLELSADQVESLRNAIDRLKGDLSSKSPFKLFETQIKAAANKIKKGGKNNIAQGISEIGEASAQFSPVISQLGQDLGNTIGDNELGSKLSSIGNALGGLGTTAAGVGQILSGDIVGGAFSAVSGISSIVSAFDGLFGANYDKYNKAKEEYESYISVLDNVIEKQKEMVASLDNENAVNSYEYAKSLVEKSAEAAKILGKERLNSGASAGSHSIGVRIQKGMSSEGWNEARKALGSAFNKATEGRMTGLFDLSIEQLEKLQVEAPTFWAKLDGDVRQYLEDIIAANENAEDLKDTLNENLTGISFDSLFDNFLDFLYDMESSAEDISDNMADYLRKSLIKSFAIENYKGKMQEWYEKWAEAIKNGEISPEEQKSLDALKNSIITGAIESAKLINDQFEYLENDSSQSSTTGSFQTMSQDTGNELNGRFTALQMAGEEIKAQNISQTESLNILTVKTDTLLSVNTETRNIADEIRTIQVNSYLELQEIRQNTGDTVKQLKSMDEKLKKIEENTKNI